MSSAWLAERSLRRCTCPRDHTDICPWCEKRIQDAEEARDDTAHDLDHDEDHAVNTYRTGPR